MSNPSILGAVVYEAETLYGEDVTTFTTLRLPTIGMPDVSGLKHDKVDANRTQQYKQGGAQWILGTMGNSTFTTKSYLPGHGSTTSGATTPTPYETYLGIVLGNVTVSAASGTTLTGGTSTIPITTASATFAPGSLCRIGTQNDTRGGAQFYPIATHLTTNLTLLANMKGTPLAADILYSAVNFYPFENPTSNSITSIRMLVLTANLRYELHGCAPTAWKITGLNPGEKPMIEITWSVAWWRESTATFPSAVATDTSNPAPIAGGTLFVNDVGVPTRVERTCRAFSIEWKAGVEIEKGPGGFSPYQENVSARRTTDDIKVTWTEDADAATTTPVVPGFGRGTTPKHVCYSGSTTAGSAIGIYLSTVNVMSVAVQKADGNINRVTFEGEANTGPTTTSDLTLSAIRIAFA